MIDKASPAGWVVQVTIAASPLKGGAQWIGDKMPGAPSFEYFNVGIAGPDKAVEATTKYLAKGKVAAGTVDPTSTILPSFCTAR